MTQNNKKGTKWHKRNEMTRKERNDTKVVARMEMYWRLTLKFPFDTISASLLRHRLGSDHGWWSGVVSSRGWGTPNGNGRRRRHFAHRLARDWWGSSPVNELNLGQSKRKSMKNHKCEKNGRSTRNKIRRTWKFRIIVQINPNITVSFPSTMSDELMLTNLIWAGKNRTFGQPSKSIRQSIKRSIYHMDN